ncbi:anti-sigma regulatory factor (Ser/Thr protein kinase) [Geodermatophilus tzadiensis]|uniref:Anti-sigma regulatory factor (Ser/Thr protein kinase) n=1 Tax=Geodermatophilus tzadiensis TaxID=1137988 RepID=A0A2T0TTM6_9ACTN|nr:sensor histidine kinase [Geodermatophilus tzadiensis]PRY49019.1 anti-sigma regulatory factor (Ser/Thr protein kinase) [Geodermatophilus tzadiensis]
MEPQGTALRHDALVYDSGDEWVELGAAFLRRGLEAGEGGVVAHTRQGLSLMREALGADASEVRFVDVSAAYTRPVRTLASYHAVYAEQLRRTPSLRAVADVQFGPDPGEWDLWTGYEAAFNRSFSHLPAWVLCTYATGSLPEAVREGVWRTHPGVVSGGTWTRSALFEEPERLLRGSSAARRPMQVLRPLPVVDGVEQFRELLARELVAERMPSARVLDMLLATSEVFVNAEQHGGGVVSIRVGRADGRFACEIVDRGAGFDDPLAGYLAPRPGVGAGLWVARQLTWCIDFFTSADGFTARIVM